MIIFSKMRLNILIQCFSATTQQPKVAPGVYNVHSGEKCDNLCT